MEHAKVLDRHLARFFLELLYYHEHPRDHGISHLKTFTLVLEKKKLTTILVVSTVAIWQLLHYL